MSCLVLNSGIHQLSGPYDGPVRIGLTGGGLNDGGLAGSKSDGTWEGPSGGISKAARRPSSEWLSLWGLRPGSAAAAALGNNGGGLACASSLDSSKLVLPKDTSKSIGGWFMGKALPFHAVDSVACMGKENLVSTVCCALVGDGTK